MINNHKVIVDFDCEVYQLIFSLADDIVYNFNTHDIVAGAIYVVWGETFKKYQDYFIQLLEDKIIHIIYCNTAEGSEILMKHNQIDIESLSKNYSFKVLTGGDLPPKIDYALYEWFLPLVLDYKENTKVIEQYANSKTLDRPYKFLFLNGRMRPHRKYLLNVFKSNGLLDQSLWSNLDSGPGTNSHFNSIVDQPAIPIKYLSPEYEVPRYQQFAATSPVNVTDKLEAKFHLFNNEWGEIYLALRPYTDTYFSLVTETVFEYPYSFRTEKIWKPIAIGHPFIVTANAGYYKDLHNLGFKTFGHLIDESFDNISNNQDRLDRIASTVNDLCQQDLPAFISAAEDVCKYNQQLLVELSTKIRSEFPQRFEKYINERFRI